MKLSGWGRCPVVEAEMLAPDTLEAMRRRLTIASPVIARGLGRSYGDSALGPTVLSALRLDRLLAFDAVSGELECEAGVSLDTVLRVFVPRGWFLPVTPGTSFVTLGGAVASDVHGKNHHGAGSFSAHVLGLKILLGNGEVLDCDSSIHAELFRATCGGMGLTGIILAVRLRLVRIPSAWMRTTTLKAKNLDDALDLFEAGRDATYSVAWIDCLARGKHLGRSLLMLGEHDEGGSLRDAAGRARSLPFDFPAGLLNHYSIAAFNTLYYHRRLHRKTLGRSHFRPYFYPLDGIGNWNRMYGRPGFLQYQCALPSESGRMGMRRLLQTIAEAGEGSFLAVLKTFGPGNGNPLSFPLAGPTLALDFRNTPKVRQLLDRLDAIVLDHGGRLYLTKDARMSAATFKRSYPRWEEVAEVRARYHAERIGSLQSKRLEIS